MADQARGSSFDLKLNLLKEGCSFSFFQAIRLLSLLNSKRTTESENITIRPELSLGFPASDIAHIEEISGEMPNFLITATFLGLYGTSSPLPTFYTEDLFREAGEDESITRDFIDIINHRLYSLFFRCLTKYRLFFQVVEQENPSYLERLFCLLGLGEEKMRKQIPGAYQLIRYAGLFTHFPRSALGLKTLLQDYLGHIPIEIIQNRSRRLSIPEDQRMCLGVSSVSLGEESYIGQEIEDRMGAFRIKIGPVNQDQFHALLPGNDDFKKLTFLIRLYLTEPLEYDIDLFLDGEVKTTCLGSPKWSSLGLDTWTFSGDYAGEMRAIFYPQNN